MGRSKIHIVSNLAISLDGRIAARGKSQHYLGSPKDRKEMLRIRDLNQAVLMGAETLRKYRKPLRSRNASHKPWNLVLSRSLQNISPNWSFFRAPEIKRVLFSTELLTQSRLKEFSRSSTVVKLPRGIPPAVGICRWLRSQGVQKLLVEGGGGVIWEFLKQDLLDEMYLTLTPWLIGGTTTPGLAGGEGFTGSTMKRMRLRSVRRVKDELFLHYVRGSVRA